MLGMALTVGPDSLHELLNYTQTEQEALMQAGYEVERWRLEQIAEMFSG